MGSSYIIFYYSRLIQELLSVIWQESHGSDHYAFVKSYYSAIVWFFAHISIRNTTATFIEMILYPGAPEWPKGRGEPS